MSSHKTPGINGFHAFLFQKGWDSLKLDLFHFVTKAFEDGSLQKETTDSLVVLILKVIHHKRLTLFFPISLCIVLYKLVTKVIVNRLKSILPILIAPSQSSFVPGRQITDNIVVVQEVVHTMCRRQSGKGLMMVKLDLEKAYEPLKWNFVMDTLWCIGLSKSWINLIMNYIQSNELQFYGMWLVRVR